ncbi:molybdopterin cofactor-binding domain-containing protein [Nesterenkonia populi]|uniref:molybdopterin cofactor-binding domain-containing protein n=1 Tax=Nesterenkonia populi TaxID=1591087 RepID=UPI0011BE9288|nr:molybdopterin cofactor-binding domain-containing protein [Nesterenkonia populi]
MDIHSVNEVVMTTDPDDYAEGDAWLAGGTVLHSYGKDLARGRPRRLLDLSRAGWKSLRWHHGEGGSWEGLEIAATCTIAEFHDAAETLRLGGLETDRYPGLGLIIPAVRAFVASYKVWNRSTVGGNVATALPAGPMTSWLSGMEATALVIGPGGSRREVPVAELVVGPARTALDTGELIRAFYVSAAHLARPSVMFRDSLTRYGRSAVFLIGSMLRGAEQPKVRLTITASTPRPVVIDLPLPSRTAGGGAAEELRRTAAEAIGRRISQDEWYDDVHGDPQWRESRTKSLAGDVLVGLCMRAEQLGGESAVCASARDVSAGLPDPTAAENPDGAEGLTVDVDGEALALDHAPGQCLRTWLRDRGAHAVKRGCDAGDCGACTVHLDGKAIHSCILPAQHAEGRRVTTLRGLSPQATDYVRTVQADDETIDIEKLRTDLHPVQKNFLDAHGFQCGYCTPGFIMTAADGDDSRGGERERRFKGNICRCTGYCSIRDALDGKTRITDSGAPGQSPAPPGGPGVVTGTADFTFDRTEGYREGDYPPKEALHMVLVRSPHAHAMIRSIDATEALAQSGVVTVLTHEDAPDVLYSSGAQEVPEVQPADTRVLDNVVRHAGQRVAAVIAESRRAAERAALLVDIDYEVLPVVLGPEEALEEGAPAVHGDKDPERSRIKDPARNLIAQGDVEIGDFQVAFEKSAYTYRGQFRTQRISHSSLETHGTIGWLDDEGRAVLRSSTQVPFINRRNLCEIFGIAPEELRVLAPRVGGGFGSKQEMLTEDIVLLAVRKVGRPVQLEFTRTEALTASTTRHPYILDVEVGADDRGRLTALSMKALSDTGAYGNHGPPVLFQSVREPMQLYSVPSKKLQAQVAYTNNPPSGAYRSFGISQTFFALESALDELARSMGRDPLQFKADNLPGMGEELFQHEEDLHHDFGGMREAVKLVQKHLRTGPLTERERAECEQLLAEERHGGDILKDEFSCESEWQVGTGTALGLLATAPSIGHHSHAKAALRPDGCYELHVGTAEFGNGTSTAHRQLAAAALGTSTERVHLAQSDTDLVRYDTGAFGSTGVSVAGKASYAAAEDLCKNLRKLAADFFSEQAGASIGAGEVKLTDQSVHCGGTGISLRRLHSWAEQQNRGEECRGEGVWAGTPRSLAFNVQGFRIAVERSTGVMRILQSVHAADAGTVLNEAQCRGQVEGGIGQAIGGHLFEELRLDEEGRMVTDILRQYHLPKMADLPLTEVHFVEATDPIGPLGAKSMSESPCIPVPAALANAVRDATGMRVSHAPLRRDRLAQALEETMAERV